MMTIMRMMTMAVMMLTTYFEIIRSAILMTMAMLSDRLDQAVRGPSRQAAPRFAICLALWKP